MIFSFRVTFKCHIFTTNIPPLYFKLLSELWRLNISNIYDLYYVLNIVDWNCFTAHKIQLFVKSPEIHLL